MLRTRFRRVVASLGTVAVVAAGLAGLSTTASAASSFSVSSNQGSCRVTQPVVKVKLNFNDKQRTSIGYSTTSYPDVWPSGRQSLRNGTYTLTLPKIAPGDSERFRIHLQRGTGRNVKTYGTPWRTFSVPTGCANLTYKKLLKKRPVPFATGKARAGEVLTAFAEGWDSVVRSEHLSFQWERSGYLKIKGATKPTYRIAAADVGKKLRVIVHVRVPEYATVRRASWYITPIRGAAFTTAPTPTIGGSATVGGTLTAYTGTWSPKPSKFAFQWYRAGNKVAGATSRSYKVTSKDKGRTVKVKVTAIRTGYEPRAVTSNSVTVR